MGRYDSTFLATAPEYTPEGALNLYCSHLPGSHRLCESRINPPERRAPPPGDERNHGQTRQFSRLRRIASADRLRDLRCFDRPDCLGRLAVAYRLLRRVSVP